MALPSAATSLRRSLQDPQVFITAPGVYDGMSARLALAAGFDALYMVCNARDRDIPAKSPELTPPIRQAPEQQPRYMAKRTSESAH